MSIYFTNHLKVQVPHTAVNDLYLLRNAGVRVKHVNAVLSRQPGQVAMWIEVDQPAIAAYKRFKAAHGILKDEVEVSKGSPHRKPSSVIMFIVKFGSGPICCLTKADIQSLLKMIEDITGAVVAKHDYIINGADVTMYIRVEPQPTTWYPSKACKDAASKDLAAQIANSVNPTLRGQAVNLTMGTATLHAYQVSTKFDVYPSPRGKTARTTPCDRCMQRVAVVPAVHDPYSVAGSACVATGCNPREGAEVVQCDATPPEEGVEAFGGFYTSSL